MCDQCNKIFKTVGRFTKHMQAGVHRAPAASMKQFVAKHVPFHIVQSMQLTSMHLKMERVDNDGDALSVQPALEGYVENTIPFK